jgi:hypothetical protein
LCTSHHLIFLADDGVAMCWHVGQNYMLLILFADALSRLTLGSSV